MGSARAEVGLESILRAATAARLSADWTQAQHLYRLAARSHPGSWGAQHDLGAFLSSIGHLEEALEILSKAALLTPGDLMTRHAMAITLLGLGRYAEGWPLAEVRYQLDTARCPKPALPHPEWRGKAVAGKRILLWIDQGFGAVGWRSR